VAAGRRILRRDLDERTAYEVRLNGMPRQAAETEARPQESQLGAEVG
jgi:hypothetical protein